MEKHFNWKGHDWRITPYWGDHHSGKPDVWYGTDSVRIEDNGSLVLDCVYNPKSFPDGFIRKYSVGYVVCEEDFKYGTFEWSAKLPQGLNMWPGLWLDSSKEWPPEIDCMEGWTRGKRDTYVKRLLWVDIHPTMHWTENGEHKSEAKFNISRFRVDLNGWNDFKVEWTPNGVSVYYNGKLIKTFNNKKMLEHFNREDILMHPIMTFDIWEDFPGEFTEERYADYKDNGSPLVVRNFKYTPYKSNM